MGAGMGARKLLGTVQILVVALWAACSVSQGPTGETPVPFGAGTTAEAGAVGRGEATPTASSVRSPTVSRGAPSVASPTASPVRAQGPGLSLIGYGAGAPDDLALDHAGAVIFSDQGNSGLNELDAEGKLHVVATGFKVPEGVVVLPEGEIVLAEQGTNRLWLVDRASGRRQLLAEIPNPTGKAGIDGLGYDPAAREVVVPDSPNGRLLLLNPRDGSWREVARGFVRPTGAAVGPAGEIYVADEFGQGVHRVDPSGRSNLVVRVSGVDDVALTQDGRLLMALLDGRLLRLEKDGSLSLLAKAEGPIHGLAVDTDGSVVFSDMKGNRILRWRP